VPLAESKELAVSSTDSSGRIVNSIALRGPAWIGGVQFHPEYKTRPGKPSPIYREFVRQALLARKQRLLNSAFKREKVTPVIAVLEPYLTTRFSTSTGKAFIGFSTERRA